MNLSHLKKAAFASAIVRSAQSMGSHVDEARFGLDATSCEIRRRGWWHILSLDVHSSILGGSQPCCSDEAQQSARAIGDGHGDDFAGSLVSAQENSVSMLFCVDQFETVHLRYSLNNRLQSRQTLEKLRLQDSVSIVDILHITMDA